ncbi:MAG: pantetheine-phosphate adenylyltransferase [Spirochaetes bacterium]|nr:pantetheine-phosphate adenylyltransferase [Spirochaetota bacterium]
MNNKKIAVYPGTFDPVTYGHIDIIKRAARIFDKLLVSVARNLHKKPLFSIEERTDLLKEIVESEKLDNVTVDSFEGLLVDYLKKKKIKVIIRGLRVVTDFDYEFAYASMNQKINPGIETVFLMTNEKYLFISSTLIKEVVKFGGDVSDFAPDNVIKKLKEKYK